MNSPFLKKAAKNYFFVLDVGNNAVKGLVLEKDKEKNAILGVSTHRYRKFGIFDSADFKTDVTKLALEKVIQEASHGLNVEAKLALVQLPPDVLRAKITSPIFNRKKPKEIISKKEEEEIYKHLLEESQEKISREFTLESGILQKELKFLNLEILEIKIDGYSVPGLQGYGGERLELTVLGIFLPDFYFSQFNKILVSLGIKVSRFSHMVDGLRTLKDNFDGIYIDIGGEFTQVIVAKDGKPQRIDQFSCGGSLFLQALSRRFGVGEEESGALSERYSAGSLSPEVRGIMHEIFVPVAKEWFSSLKSKMREIKFLLPKTVYLFGGGSLILEIKEILEDGDWEIIPFVERPAVKIFEPKTAKDLIFGGEKAVSLEDKTNKLVGPAETQLFLLCLNV